MTGGADLPILVVTPTLGRSPYLAEAMDSIHRCGTPVQHVVVTPPDSVGLVRRVCPGCTIVAERRPAGIYAAIETGIAAAAPWEWFTYLNDDDLLTPAFGRMAGGWTASADACEISYGDVRWIGPDGGNLGLMPVERHPERIAALVTSGIAPFTQQGTLTGRTVYAQLGGFDTSYRLAADFDFWVRALRAGARFRYAAVEVASWRIHSEQASADRNGARSETRTIAASMGPQSPARRHWTRARFRAQNLSRYIERYRATGSMTSDGVFDDQSSVRTSRP
jgi:hypothetical protein